MRTLASLGVLASCRRRTFRLDPARRRAQDRRAGQRAKRRAGLRRLWMWTAFREFGHSVRTGDRHGQSPWHGSVRLPRATIQTRPRYFSDAMVGFHGGEPPAVAEAFDFSRFDTIVDVGGATGNMLAHILTRHPRPARRALRSSLRRQRSAGADRGARPHRPSSRSRTGDFFERVPEGGDAYLLSHIIHDWTEEQCLSSSATCRRAMRPREPAADCRVRAAGRRRAAPGPTRRHGDARDSPAAKSARRRNTARSSALAGFKVDRVVPTASPVSIVEARVA